PRGGRAAHPCPARGRRAVPVPDHLTGGLIMSTDSMSEMAAAYTEFPVETLFVSPERLYPVLREAAVRAAAPAPVGELDTSRLTDEECCRQFRAAAVAGRFLIVRCPQRLPPRLRQSLYVVFKDEAILSGDGSPHSGQGPGDGFGVLLWLTPEAYLEMNEPDRQRFLQVTGYRFYYPADPEVREDLGQLTAGQRAVRQNAFATLKAQPSEAERRRPFPPTLPPPPGPGGAAPPQP